MAKTIRQEENKEEVKIVKSERKLSLFAIYIEDPEDFFGVCVYILACMCLYQMSSIICEKKKQIRGPDTAK